MEVPPEVTAKTVVKADDGSMTWFETIKLDGDLWIATGWEKSPYPSMWKPKRLIRVAQDELRDMGRYPNDATLHLYELIAVIPKAVLFDPIPLAPNLRFAVQEAPNLHVRRKADSNP
jgi:hypothetical protein